MNKNSMTRLFAVLMTGCAMLMTSCKETDPVTEQPDPTFPVLVERIVQAGESVTLTASAELDWEVSVPENTLQWFWIQDGRFKTSNVKGNAGEDVTVVIGVSESEEFDTDRICEVTMKMGGQSKVIAKLTRPSKEKHLTLYVAKVVDGEIQFVEDGSSYDYDTQEAQSVDLIWTGSDFRLPVKVEANCGWTVDTPEWARVDVPENTVGTVNVNVYGVPSEYPLEAAQGKIQFMYGETVIKEYNITIPGCEDKFSYAVGMGLTELDFNFNGQIKTAMGYIEGPATATISGTSGTKVFAVEYVDGKYDIASPDDPSWLVITEDAYDDSEGADVLQTRNVTVSVKVNEEEDRQAVIFFLPPSGWNRGKELFTDAADAVREEFLQYAVTVIQHSSDQEYISMLSNASDMATGGATFAVSEDASLFEKFGYTRYAYELTYTNQYARDNSRMSFTSAATSFKVFDEAGTDKTGDASYFLTVTLDDNMMGGVIDMVAETMSVGYVVLYGASDNVLAVVKCIFDPESVIGEVADVKFIGDSEMYAPMVGATLEQLTEGALYNQYREGDALVYHLTYTMAGMPMRISIPNTVVTHTVNPYVFKNYIRVNNNIYDEVFVNNKLGGIELVDGGVDIYLEMPEERDYMRGNIIFADAEGTTVLVLVCTLDLTGAGE